MPSSQDDDETTELDLLEERNGFGVGHALNGHTIDGEDLISCVEKK